MGKEKFNQNTITTETGKHRNMERHGNMENTEIHLPVFPFFPVFHIFSGLYFHLNSPGILLRAIVFVCANIFCVDYNRTVPPAFLKILFKKVKRKFKMFAARNLKRYFETKLQEIVSINPVLMADR